MTTSAYRTVASSEPYGTALRRRSSTDGAPRSVPTASRLPYRVIGQAAVCVLPAAAAVTVVRPALATYWYFGTLLALLGLNFVRGMAFTNLALVIAVLPMAQALRGFFFYNSVLGLLAGAVLVVLLQSSRYARSITRSGLHWAVLVACIYWLLSFMLSGQYWNNLKGLELMGSATAIVLLAQHRRFLGVALLGMAGTLLSMGLALLPFGPRLGLVRVEGMSLGNPITFGIPLALLLLLLVADGGRYLCLERRKGLRMALIAAVGILLVLSTSRGSWLVAGVGLGLVFLLNGRHRRAVLITATAAMIGVAVLMQTDKAEALTDAFERTFASETSLLERTSGRSDQWELFFHLMGNETPVWGFGPGSGRQIYAQYSAIVSSIEFKVGRQFMWHSLYMHLGVEAGLVGLLVLAGLFGALLASNVRWWTATSRIVPLLGTVGFALVGVGVTGLDAASGLLLGFGFVSRTYEGTGGRPRPSRRRPGS